MKSWISIDDKELEVLINALNEIEGIETSESCFGHSADLKKTQFHQSCAYIGMYVRNQNAVEVLQDILKKFIGKRYLDESRDSYFQIFLCMIISWSEKLKVIEGSDKVQSYRAPYFRLEIHPKHNPAFSLIGIKEKLKGIEELTDFLFNLYPDFKKEVLCKIED